MGDGYPFLFLDYIDDVKEARGFTTNGAENTEGRSKDKENGERGGKVKCARKSFFQ